jgi:hypothetical protein
MKSLFHASIGRLTFGIVLLLTAAIANAQSEVPGTTSGTDHVMVRFLGAQDDMLVFNVSYYNPQGNKFVVAIKDQDGNKIYQDVFKDKSFYKQFKLPKTDKDRIEFVFSNGQDAPVVKTFAVNVNSRLVQEVAIKKL